MIRTASLLGDWCEVLSSRVPIATNGAGAAVAYAPGTPVHGVAVWELDERGTLALVGTFALPRPRRDAVVMFTVPTTLSG